MTIIELIAALEAATGPSRELDGWIYRMLYEPIWEPDIPEDRKVLHCRCHAPGYTASLGAALTAVPKGRFLFAAQEDRKRIIYKGDRHESLGTYTVVLQHVDGGRAQRGQGKTLAIALLIAVFKAGEKPGATSTGPLSGRLSPV